MRYDARCRKLESAPDYAFDSGAIPAEFRDFHHEMAKLVRTVDADDPGGGRMVGFEFRDHCLHIVARPSASGRDERKCRFDSRGC